MSTTSRVPHVNISIKSYSKVLKEKGQGGLFQKTKNIFKLVLIPLRVLKSITPIQSSTLFNRINFLNKAPFGVVVVFWLGILTLVVLIANKLRYNFFVDLITKNFPEAVTVPADSTGKPLYMSALDRMFAEFNAINNVGYLIFFVIILRTFLKTVWETYNPRKQQVFGRI